MSDEKPGPPEIPKPRFQPGPPRRPANTRKPLPRHIVKQILAANSESMQAVPPWLEEMEARLVLVLVPFGLLRHLLGRPLWRRSITTSDFN